MAETNLNSDMYFADADGLNRVYLDCDPNPPLYWEPPPRMRAAEQCLPGVDNDGDFMPGQWYRFDGGASRGGMRLTVEVPYMTADTMENLADKYYALENVQFSPNNGGLIVELQWEEFSPRRDRGRQSYTCRMVFGFVALLHEDDDDDEEEDD